MRNEYEEFLKSKGEVPQQIHASSLEYVKISLNSSVLILKCFAIQVMAFFIALSLYHLV